MANGDKQILGLMGFGMIFSLVGAEISKAKAPSGSTASKGALSEPVVIILGGTIATALLMFIADLGPNGALIGKGLAGVSCATGVLVNGKPVWDGINNLLGKPGGNTSAVGQAALAEAGVGAVSTGANGGTSINNGTGSHPATPVNTGEIGQ